MPWPWVSRDAYAVVCQALALERQRSDELLQQLLRLRRDGFTVSRAGEVRHPPDREAEALAKAEGQQRKRIGQEEFLKKAMAKIQKDNPHVTDAAALKEARRLLTAATMEQPPA